MWMDLIEVFWKMGEVLGGGEYVFGEVVDGCGIDWIMGDGFKLVVGDMRD